MTFYKLSSGFIGKNWAMIFASAGYTVSIYDLDKNLRERVLVDIKIALDDHRAARSLRGTLTTEEQLSLISVHDNMAECVQDAVYVQVIIYVKLVTE